MVSLKEHHNSNTLVSSKTNKEVLNSSYKKTNGLDVWAKYSPQYSENFINENRPPITNSFIKKCFLDFDNFLEPIKKNKTPPIRNITHIIVIDQKEERTFY